VSLPPLTLNAWLRYDVIDSTLRGLTDVRSILEVGCGQGALAARLARSYEYVGMELDPVSCAKAQERLAQLNRGRVVCGDLSTLDASEFDLVCAFEVLEHIEDDVGALRVWRGQLRDGGWLLFSVPAYASRWGAADQMAGHFRRYEPEGAIDLVQAAGFTDPTVWTYGFPLGHVLEHARNLLAARQQRSDSLEARTAASGRWFQPPEWLAGGTQVATAPFRRIQRRFLESGRGTGLVVLARRADELSTGPARGPSSPAAGR
jgi:SAM-dependent methyltransferase